MKTKEDIISLMEEHRKKETKKIFIKYFKKWPWFIAFLIIGIGLGLFKSKNSPNIFLIKSRMLVTEENQNISSVLSFDNPIMGLSNNTNVENKIGILQSYTLFRKALLNLKWETTWYSKELLYHKELYNDPPFELVVPPHAMNVQDVKIKIVALNEKEYTLEASGETTQNGFYQTIDLETTHKFGVPYNNEFFNFTLENKWGQVGKTYRLVFNSINKLTNLYLKRTDIILEDPNSDLISIIIKGPIIQKEADFINELNNVFIQFGMDHKKASSDNSLEFIDSQLSRIKTQLKSAEENFSNYRRNKQVINLSQEAQLIYAKLEEIENEKYMTKLQLDYYRDLQEYLDDSEKISEMVNPSVIGITDAGLNEMLGKLMELYGKREILSYSVKEKSPSFKILEKEIKVTRDALDETLRNQLKATQSIVESIENRYNKIEERVKDLPETEKELIKIQREFDLNNELYTYLLQKRAEASISKASIAPEVQIIDPAMVESSTLIGPNLVIHLGAGALLGIFLPFLFITTLSFFNTKIETKEEIEKLSQIPVLDGIIKHKYRSNLPVVSYPRSGVAESFRGVKSNINAILENHHSKVISINSLIPGEGKSFVSSNLSAILTKSKSRTLLIGADMHKPTLHKYFNVSETEGLSNFFKNEKQIHEIVNETTIPKLDFIQSGPIPQNPSDLINPVKLEQLIDFARQNYDFIVIDNAPLILVPDAILTSKYSDISLFTLRIGYSHKEQVKQINKIVNFNKIKQAAIIVNGAPDLGYGYGNKYWKKGYGDYRQRMSIA